MSAHAVTTWQLTATGGTWGLAFDAAVHVWTADLVWGLLYRFEPGTTQLCSYAIPGAGISDYILARGSELWIGDAANDRIVRLDTAGVANRFTTWQLTGNAYPQGLAMDAAGNLWWADESQALLGRLEPGLAAGQLTTFALPTGLSPELVALQGSRVWYSESAYGVLGALDPALAQGTRTTPR